MNAVELLQKLPALYRGDAGIRRIVQFNISQPMYLTIADGACTLSEGTADDADLALGMADQDLVDLFSGKLNGMMAVMTGKLKLKGDVGLAQQITKLFDAKQLS